MKKRFLRELENNTTLTSETITDSQLSDNTKDLQENHITSQLSDEANDLQVTHTTFQSSESPKNLQETHITFQASEDSNDMQETHKTRPACRFYMKGKCKHSIKGKKCAYDHPKACPKLMKHGNKAPMGCNAGTRCPQFHPRMCSSSIRNGTCFNNLCTFAHVKGTKRQPEPAKTKSDTNQNDSTDFLKILDNFRLQMIAFINESLKPPHRNQILQQPHPVQTTSKTLGHHLYPQVSFLQPRRPHH